MLRLFNLASEADTDGEAPPHEQETAQATFSANQALALALLLNTGIAFIAYFFAEPVLQMLGLDSSLEFMAFPIMLVIMQYLTFRPIATRLGHIFEALRHINENKATAELSASKEDFLGPIVEQVNILVRERETLKAMRGTLYEQISGTAAQEERKRLARDLHDSIKQQVFSMSISASAAYAHLDSNPAAAREALRDVKQSAQEAMVEMRALLQQLAPAPLEKSGLIEALREQAEALSYRTGATVETDFGTLPDNSLFPIGAQEAVFRIAQESLSNIARHARANRVLLRLHQEGDFVCLCIEDDGQGFNIDNIKLGMGLNNIRTRAEAIRATMALSSQPGQGTRIEMRFPLVEELVEEDADLITQNPWKVETDRYLFWFRAFAWAASAVVFGTSLLLYGVVRDSQPDEDGPVLQTTTDAVLLFAADPVDVVLQVIHVGLIITLVAGLAIGIWSYVRAQGLRMRLYAKLQGTWHFYGVERQIRLTQLALLLVVLWFIPMIWIAQPYSAAGHLLFCALMSVAILRNYYDSFRMCTLELHQLPLVLRLAEIKRFQDMVRSGWASIGFLLFTLLITGSLRNGIQILPVDSDAWMTSIMLLVALLLIANQFVNIAYYHRQHRLAQDELASASV